MCCTSSKYFEKFQRNTKAPIPIVDKNVFAVFDSFVSLYRARYFSFDFINNIAYDC